MSTREDLEAALRARPDDSTLLVYADFLQAQGDPRGELIALDLRSPAMSMQSVENRRGQLLRSWLGDEIEVRWDPDAQLWHAGELGVAHATFECGFVDVFIEDEADEAMLARLLHGPAGDYVRRLSIKGDTELLERVLARVVAKVRPWLQHLALARVYGVKPLSSAGKLATALPHLEVLDLIGPSLLDRFTHPNLRELAITGSRSIDLLEGPPLPALHTIDFAFDPVAEIQHRLFAPARVPALRRLYVSRAEPGAAQLFEWLGTIGVASQITHLELPSIRSEDDRLLVQAAIDRMPMLREIAIARAYACHQPVGELRHAWARIKTPAPYPWRPRETFGRLLAIDGYSTDLAALVDVLEEQYGELPVEVRGLWDRFWTSVDDYIDEQAFSAADLVQALGALELPAHLAALRDHLKNRLAQRPRFFAVLRWV